MPRVSLRVLTAALAATLFAACSGGRSSIPPGQHTANGKRTTPATFTIKWTNPTAAAAMRHKETISPAARSITVTINGKSAATANRGTGTTQAIALDAPVGIDQFVFNIYDQQAGQGHLLGSAQVNQQIVDGAANNVSAAIQALCSVTNVSKGSQGFGVGTYGPATGVYAPSIQTFVVVGNSAASVAIEPEDVDGDVIITDGTVGTVAYSASGSTVYVNQLDGTHLSFTPQGYASRTDPGETVTAAAAGCPSTTFTVKTSPAIYEEGSDGGTLIVDWYDDFVSGNTLQPGDKLIGFDTALQQLITYNATSGAVSAYDITLSTRTPRFIVHTASLVAWSNYLNGVFGAFQNGALAAYFTSTNGTLLAVSSPFGGGLARSVAAGPSRGDNAGFSTDGTHIYAFSLTTRGVTGGIYAANPPVNSIAVNDQNGQLDVFNSTSPFTTIYQEDLTFPQNGDRGYNYPPTIGAVDTDASDLYAFGNIQDIVEATSANGVPLPGFDSSGPGAPPGIAIVVVSSNENSI